MEHKRQRVQFGWVCLKERKKRRDVWVLRYRENLPEGSKKRRSETIGTVEEFPTESQARKAALSWLFSMNAEASNGTAVSFGALIQRYLAEEIPERPSTASRYRCWLLSTLRLSRLHCERQRAKWFAWFCLRK
jgi:integrase